MTRKRGTYIKVYHCDVCGALWVEHLGKANRLLGLNDGDIVEVEIRSCKDKLEHPHAYIDELELEAKMK